MSRIPDRFWYLCVPIVFCLGVIFIENFTHICISACEDGPLEELQSFTAFAAFGLGIATFRLSKGQSLWVRIFFGFGTLACLYIGLEEISYGQRIFGWDTPLQWGLVNDQDETNLHNASSWLDQKPRVLLELGVITGGLIIPALRRWKKAWLPQAFAAVYPSGVLLTTAAIATAIHGYDYILDWTHMQNSSVIGRISELQEIYLYWFVFLYFLFKRRELKLTSARSGR